MDCCWGCLVCGFEAVKRYLVSKVSQKESRHALHRRVTVVLDLQLDGLARWVVAIRGSGPLICVESAVNTIMPLRMSACLALRVRMDDG